MKNVDLVEMEQFIRTVLKKVNKEELTLPLALQLIDSIMGAKSYHGYELDEAWHIRHGLEYPKGDSQ